METKKSKCLQCGSCCKDPVIKFAVTDDIAEWLAGYGIVAYLNPDGVLESGIQVNTTCKHLRFLRDRSTYCELGDSKPQICKDYPFPDTELKEGCGYRD